MRRFVAGMAAVMTLAALPSASQAERIGPNLKDRYAPAYLSCSVADFCINFQTRTNGHAVRAPFSGTITKWHAIEPYGNVWLQVLRKRDNGSYKSVRSSDTEQVLTDDPGNSGELYAFHTHLRIKRGDFVGVGADDFYASHIGDFDQAGAGTCRKGLVPGPPDGESAMPNPSYTGCGDLLLYNATLHH